MRARVWLILVIAAPALLAPAQGATGSPIERALSYLAAGQNDDGSFDAPITNVVEAAAQAGRDPKSWPSRDRSAFSELAPYGFDDVQVYNSKIRIAYAAATAGYDPRSVNGVDYVEEIRKGFTGAQFGSPATMNDDTWAILALRAAGVPANDPQIQAAAVVVGSTQALDGGWSYTTPGFSSGTDITGMALAALSAAGSDLADENAARAFLDSTYVQGGGHKTGPTGSGINVHSTVWAIVGYHALGFAPSSGSEDILRGAQQDDGGFPVTVGSNGSNAFATSEALPMIAGVTHPFPSYVPATIRKPNVPARENATFGLDSLHDRLTLTFRETNVSGAGRTFRFPAAGSYHYDYLAEGSGFRARGSGEIDVRSARPLVGALPAEVTVHRPAPLTLDLSSARDPDGQVVGARIDWGDGNESENTSHAYALPGEFILTARVVDNAGEWSENTTMRVLVPNRAPTITLPAQVIGDRVLGATFDVRATDPDGDAIRGTGARSLAFDALGNVTYEVNVTDAFGAIARASVTIEIVNLAPTIAISSLRVGDGEIDLVANATDPDGPVPSVTWIVAGADHSSARVRVALPPGEHFARAIALDADGAAVNATLTITIEAPGEAPAPPAVAPEIGALDAVLSGGALVVRYDASPDAVLTLAWRSDAGDGERAIAASPVTLALPGARWASVTLTAERAGLVASRSTGLVVDASASAPPARAVDEDAAPIVVAAATSADADAPADAPLETTALVQGAKNEAPLPPWLALAALCAAIAIVRRRP